MTKEEIYIRFIPIDIDSLVVLYHLTFENIMTRQPLLSICIPTYNRAPFLKKTLESITTAEIFKNTNDVEIVISDNCSTDDTQDICSHFIQQFPHKIHYSKTEENIGGDRNFYRVLSLARGKCLKLNNDKCSFLPHTLDTLIDIIKEHESEEYILFFPNKIKYKDEDSITCKDLTTFIDTVSYHSTWIGGFSIWKNDLEQMNTLMHATHLQLLQTAVLYHFLASGRAIQVYNQDLFVVQQTYEILPYNPAQVFGVNYFGLMKPYIQEQKLEPSMYEKEKHRVLFKLIRPFSIKYKLTAIQYWNDIIFLLKPLYKNNLYFYSWTVSSFIQKLLFPYSTSLHLRCKFLLHRLLKHKEKAHRYHIRLCEHKAYVKRNQ